MDILEKFPDDILEIDISNIKNITSLDFSRFTQLQILNCTNNEITELNNLPDSLIYLTFGKKFNKQVESLPKNLIHLTFGEDFNHPIDNLPNSIRYLTFDKYCSFN